ncbi:hypothetical protein METHP14_80080 [Pseudomonas sp. P14-2025]
MAPPFVVLSARLFGRAPAQGNGGYNTVGTGVWARVASAMATALALGHRQGLFTRSGLI